MEPHLHWSFHRDHVLFGGLVLRSFKDFLIVAPCLIIMCLIERFLTFRLELSPAPRFLLRARWGKHVRWSILYWVVNFLRLCYMLAAMTLQIGIIIVIVTSLTLGQLLLECYRSRLDDAHSISESREDTESRTSLIQSSRSFRSKFRPYDISIYPLRSDLARPYAVASQLKVTEDMRQSGEENLAWGIREDTLEVQRAERNSARESRGNKSSLTSESDSDSES